MDEAVFTKWSKLYQSEVNRPSSAGLDNVLPNPGPQLGAFYGKATLWYGDAAFAAGRRIANQKWAEHGTPSYSYFFDTPPANLNSTIFGAAHFQEIPYVFANTEAVGWDTDPFPSEPRKRQKYIKLVEVMSRMWISFVVTGSPNHHRSESYMSITCEEKYFSNIQQFPI